MDYRLQDGQEFTVTVCGYSGKVQHLTIGVDTLRNLRRSFANITDSGCEASQHCLAVNCSLNRTPPEHLAHLLEMEADEPLDKETTRICGTSSTIDYMVKFAEKMNDLLPGELRKRRDPKK